MLKRMEETRIEHKVHERMREAAIKLEERQDKLRDLLAGESQQYEAELEQKASHTFSDRVTSMREKARELRERRETERAKLAEEKYEQQLRDTSEELRTRMSQERTKEVAAERFEQIRIKQELELEQQAVERLYADMWARDNQARMHKEEADALKRLEKTREMIDIIQQQMAELKAKKEAEKLLKAHISI